MTTCSDIRPIRARLVALTGRDVEVGQAVGLPGGGDVRFRVHRRNRAVAEVRMDLDRGIHVLDPSDDFKILKTRRDGEAVGVVLGLLATEIDDRTRGRDWGPGAT